ncbi:MAG: tetratricopeptide repeat protein [Nitrospirota bacterium]
MSLIKKSLAPALLLPPILAALLLFITAAPADAYLVYFKNGSTMEVLSHRVQGNMVYLKMQGGETGFDKNKVDMVKTLRDYDAYQQVIKKASRASGDGDHIGALQLYQALVGMDKDDAQARFLLGCELMKLKKYDDAAYNLMRVQELNPHYPQVNTRLGDIYYRQKKYDDAIDKYLLALDEDPKDKEAHLGLGMSYARQDMFNGAIKELHKALESRPDYARAYAMLGFVYYKKSKFDKAMANLDRAEKLDPRLPEAHYYKGLLYGVLGVESRDSAKRLDYLDKSIDAFRKAVQLRKDYPEAYANLGTAFYKRGSVARAVEEFKIAISQKPDMAVAHNNLAGIYLRQGYYEQAVTEAKNAVSYEPNLVEEYFIMGNAYADLEDGAVSEDVKARLDKVLREGGAGGPAADGGTGEQ